MPQEVIRQRIKYLVEHGELYPPPTTESNHRSIKHLQWMMAAMVAINLVQCVELWLR
jgi:hypothetical protein